MQSTEASFILDHKTCGFQLSRSISSSTIQSSQQHSTPKSSLHVTLRFSMASLLYCFHGCLPSSVLPSSFDFLIWSRKTSDMLNQALQPMSSFIIFIPFLYLSMNGNGCSFHVYSMEAIMILGHDTMHFNLSLIIYTFGNPLCANNARLWMWFRICFSNDIRCEFCESARRSACSIACVSIWHRLVGRGTVVVLLKTD